MEQREWRHWPAGSREPEALPRRLTGVSPMVRTPEAKGLLAGAACNSCARLRRGPPSVSLMASL
jgi:hypothetical protein